MNSLLPTLMVSVTDSTVIVKISGRATFNSSVDLKTLVKELGNRGYRRFVLDLSDCLVMDSTFLGVLAGFGKNMTAAPGAENNGRVELMCPNQRVSELLDNLCVTHLFKVINDPNSPVEKFEPVAPGCAPKEEITRTCLEAHLTLMNVNPANIPKFKEVTRFLAEDLEKMKAGGK